MIAQIVGGVLGALVLWIIASGAATGAPSVLAANGWDLATGYSMVSAFIAEAVATFIFVTVILGVTSKKHETAFAGLVIGLTLIVIHLCLIPITGTSVNPARSIGPALFFGSVAIGQLWLFIILAPLIGAAVAGLFAKAGSLKRSDERGLRGPFLLSADGAGPSRKGRQQRRSQETKRFTPRRDNSGFPA